MVSKCIYIDVLSARDRYSEREAGEVQGKGELSSAAHHKEFTKRRTDGEFPHAIFLGERSKVGCASALECLRVLRENFTAEMTGWPLELEIKVWRNSWQQQGLKKNTMR